MVAPLHLMQSPLTSWCGSHWPVHVGTLDLFMWALLTWFGPLDLMRVAWHDGASWPSDVGPLSWCGPLWPPHVSDLTWWVPLTSQCELSKPFQSVQRSGPCYCGPPEHFHCGSPEHSHRGPSELTHCGPLVPLNENTLNSPNNGPLDPLNTSILPFLSTLGIICGHNHDDRCKRCQE